MNRQDLCGSTCPLPFKRAATQRYLLPPGVGVVPRRHNHRCRRFRIHMGAAPLGGLFLEPFSLLR